MTTEDEFQALLDANPDNHQTRLVFADWLQERNDPRAEGYRALGLLRVIPNCWTRPGFLHWWWGNAAKRWEAKLKFALLPEDWFGALPGPKQDNRAYPEHDGEHSRRKAEDAAALGFSKLPEHRRRELLAAAPA